MQSRLDAMPLHVASRDLERSGRKIHGIDPGLRESQRARNGDATRAGAEVDEPLHAFGLDPRREACGDQLGEWRPRHDHALVDFEFEPGEPHATHQVGDGYPAAQPFSEQAEHLRDLRLARLDCVSGLGIGVVETERMEDQGRGVVPRIHRAVAVGQTAGVELARAKADQLRDRGCGRRLAGEREGGRRHGRCGPMG